VVKIIHDAAQRGRRLFQKEDSCRNRKPTTAVRARHVVSSAREPEPTFENAASYTRPRPGTELWEKGGYGKKKKATRGERKLNDCRERRGDYELS